MTDTILTDMQLSDVTGSRVINAPVERVDLATWLFKLSEGEYRRCCPPDCISCGTTLTDTGKPMVINGSEDWLLPLVLVVSIAGLGAIRSVW